MKDLIREIEKILDEPIEKPTTKPHVTVGVETAPAPDKDVFLDKKAQATVNGEAVVPAETAAVKDEEVIDFWNVPQLYLVD